MKTLRLHLEFTCDGHAHTVTRLITGSDYQSLRDLGARCEAEAYEGFLELVDVVETWRRGLDTTAAAVAREQQFRSLETRIEPYLCQAWKELPLKLTTVLTEPDPMLPKGYIVAPVQTFGISVELDPETQEPFEHDVRKFGLVLSRLANAGKISLGKMHEPGWVPTRGQRALLLAYAFSRFDTKELNAWLGTCMASQVGSRFGAVWPRFVEGC